MWKFVSGGESHGRYMTAILEGLPSNLKIDIDFINQELSRRREGFGRGKRMAIEKDTAEIVSGIRNGVTLGSPITILIKNRDFSLGRNDLSPLLAPRPGHADLAGILKYNFKDCRNVWERASARCTAPVVACGAIAKILLYQFRLTILSHVISIGHISIRPAKKLSYEELLLRVEKSPLRVHESKSEKTMIREIEKAQKKGDTLGGIFEVVSLGVPVGLGTYTESGLRLDGRIAQAVMSIPSVKGVEIGLGFASSGLPGSLVHDKIFYNKGEKRFFRKTNHAGGIEGGISNGMPIVVRGAMKPIPTLQKPLSSVNIRNKKKAPAEVTRADVCSVPAGGIVGESAVALELCHAMREKFGGDSLDEMKQNFSKYIRNIRRR
jgi:chorismate synthase